MEPTTMMINKVKYVREDSVPRLAIPKGDFAPYEIGEDYHVETVTKYFLGTLIQVTEKELVFANCAWIPSTGRYNKYMSGTAPDECEPYPKDALVIIGRGSLIDCVKRQLFLEIK